MSAPRGTRPRPGFVNALLATNFRVMAAAGEGVLRPFLLDVPRLGGLSATLAGMVASNPGLVPRILAHVGPGPLLDWGGHFAALVLYTLLALASRPLLRPLLLARGAPLRGLLPPRARHTLARLVDAWEYGSGLDYAAPGHRGGGPGGK